MKKQTTLTTKLVKHPPKVIIYIKWHTNQDTRPNIIITTNLKWITNTSWLKIINRLVASQSTFQCIYLGKISDKQLTLHQIFSSIGFLKLIFTRLRWPVSHLNKGWLCIKDNKFYKPYQKAYKIWINVEVLDWNSWGKRRHYLSKLRDSKHTGGMIVWNWDEGVSISWNCKGLDDIKMTIESLDTIPGKAVPDSHLPVHTAGSDVLSCSQPYQACYTFLGRSERYT